MRISYASGALALCTTASAFSNTSPFVLLSTTQLAEAPRAGQLETSSYVEKTAKGFLSSCPTDRYLVVQQPSLNADELSDANSQAAPNLQRALAQENVAVSWSVADVMGDVSFSEITRSINDGCTKAGRKHQLEELRLPALPSGDSESRLGDNDYILGESLRTIQAGDSYTIVYLASGAEAPPLKGSPAHAELKREVSPSPQIQRDDSGRDTRHIFGQYELFNAGVFMVIFGFLILITIIAAAINVLSGLSISYMAFAKEMGPAAQKKQQ